MVEEIKNQDGESAEEKVTEVEGEFTDAIKTVCVNCGKVSPENDDICDNCGGMEFETKTDKEIAKMKKDADAFNAKKEKEFEEQTKKDEKLRKELSENKASDISEEGAPEEGAPEEGAPEEGAPEEGAPEEGAPEEENKVDNNDQPKKKQKKGLFGRKKK